MSSARVSILIPLLLGLVAGDLCAGGHRSALLIGQSKYKGFTLQGVSESLDHVAGALGKQQFRVTRVENVNRDKLREAVEAFARSTPAGGTALIYYCGLAAHVERFGKTANYLRPVDVDINSEGDYRGRTLSMVDLRKTLAEQSGAQRVILALDCCFDSPIRPEDDSVRGGLTAEEVDERTLVVLPVKPETVTLMPAKNAPTRFANAFARHLPLLDDSAERFGQELRKTTETGWIVGFKDGLGATGDMRIVDEPDDGSRAGDAFVNSIGMAFRYCPPGEFVMGSEDADSPATSDRTPVPVRLSRGYFIGEHEVTQRDYRNALRRNPPVGFSEGPQFPYWGASELKSVTDFCKKLTEIERKAGRLPSGWEYDCPTEAEWEYACRAGSTSRYCFGDTTSDLSDYGNFADRSLRDANPAHFWASDAGDDGFGEEFAPVGSYKPNAWGIHDMHGNVAELVSDHLNAERTGGVDPEVRLEKEGVTQIRGGAWCSQPLYCESSFRNAAAPGEKRNYVGFRIVLRKTE